MFNLCMRKISFLRKTMPFLALLLLMANSAFAQSNPSLGPLVDQLVQLVGSDPKGQSNANSIAELNKLLQTLLQNDPKAFQEARTILLNFKNAPKMSGNGTNEKNDILQFVLKQHLIPAMLNARQDEYFAFVEQAWQQLEPDLADAAVSKTLIRLTTKKKMTAQEKALLVTLCKGVFEESDARMRTSVLRTTTGRFAVGTGTYQPPQKWQKPQDSDSVVDYIFRPAVPKVTFLERLIIYDILMSFEKITADEFRKALQSEISNPLNASDQQSLATAKQMLATVK